MKVELGSWVCTGDVSGLFLIYSLALPKTTRDGGGTEGPISHTSLETDRTKARELKYGSPLTPLSHPSPIPCLSPTPPSPIPRPLPNCSAPKDPKTHLPPAHQQERLPSPHSSSPPRRPYREVRDYHQTIRDTREARNFLRGLITRSCRLATVAGRAKAEKEMENRASVGVH